MARPHSAHAFRHTPIFLALQAAVLGAAMVVAGIPHAWAQAVGVPGAPPDSTPDPIGQAVGTGSSHGPVSALPTVTVTASSERSHEPPPPYAGGQVASGGRVGLLGNKDFMETPFNTISYTDTFVQDAQAMELSRVISLTDPGVFNDGAIGLVADSFSIRGFGVANSDVALGGLYGLLPFYRISPEIAERVEVLKGPSALLNGMPPGGSVGGSINLVPKRAGDVPLARITGTFASDAQLGMHADLGQRFGAEKQLGIRFNGVWRDGDSAMAHQSKAAKLAALGLDWRSDRLRLSADLYSGVDKVDVLNRGIGLAAGLPVPRAPQARTMLSPDGTFSTSKDEAIVLRAEADVTRDITAYASYGRSHTDFDALASTVYTVYNRQGDYRANYAHQRSIYDRESADAGLRTRFRTGGVGHELALSATHYQHDNKFGFLRNMLPKDWEGNLYRSSAAPGVDSSFSNAPLSRTSALHTTSWGVANTASFAQDRLQLTLGVRRQRVVSDTFNGSTGIRTARYDASATTPVIALLAKASDRLSVYANYIEGLSQGSTAPATAANAGEVFPPFKTKQKEIGIKTDMQGFGTTLSVFQIARPSSYTDPASNVFSFGGEQRNRGLEWSFFGEASKGVRVLGGLAYTQARLTRTAGGNNQGKSATATPEWQAKTGVEWDVPTVQGLTLAGNAVSVSKQYINADNSLWVAGRTVYDLGTRYAMRVGRHPVAIRAAVQNVANKAYWAGALSSGLGAPRTVVMSVSVDL
ncbi:TonB-dependent siderophore receptor [Xylophilus sp. GW821-FHT01B05]